jgi:hypothetical protein
MTDWCLPPEIAEGPFGHPTIDSAVYAGWHAILRDLHEQLAAIDPEYGVDQFKEKFGTLRVYFIASSPDLIEAMNDAVDEAAVRSAVTCEYCGESGKLHSE